MSPTIRDIYLGFSTPNKGNIETDRRGSAQEAAPLSYQTETPRDDKREKV